MLQEIPLPEVALGSSSITSGFRAWELRLFVDLAHVTDVVRALLKSVTTSIKTQIRTVFVRTGSLAGIPSGEFINSNVVIVPQVLRQMVLALESVCTTVSPAVWAGIALNVCAMVVLVPPPHIKA